MNEFGFFLLVAAWMTSLAGIATGILNRNEHGGKFPVTHLLSILGAAFSVLGLVALGTLFVAGDYSNQYVWQFSNNSMPTLYKITAIWGGMDGSMFLWATFVSIAGAIFSWQQRRDSSPRITYAIATLHSSVFFFLTVVLFFTNPFRWLKSDIIPPDGNGLNPLLQNPYMAIHPPTLYAGFTLLAVPAAVAVGALASRGKNESPVPWLSVIRTWSLVAWGILTLGIVLGGHWAYLELGWGGFWAWDPVENASFLPWLSATAFLHTAMAEQKRGVFKVWNAVLILLTYFLTVFATFLTRSGIVQSVHSFASSDIGWIFLTYLGFMLISATYLVVSRLENLKPTNFITSILSREAFFIFNNIILLSILFATFWGMLFPVFSEKLFGEKMTVGIPFYNAINMPLFLALFTVMFLGQLLSWKEDSIKRLRKTLLSPLLSALFVVAVLIWGGITAPYPLFSYGICTAIFLSIFHEIRRGITSAGATTTLKKNGSRYGAFIVHIGAVMMTIAVTASMAHKTEKEFSLAAGESTEVGRYSVSLNEISDGEEPNYDWVKTSISIKDKFSGDSLYEMAPEMRIYKRNQETTTEVALKMTPREDLYLVMAGLDDTGTRAALKVFINPLQVWLWIGTLVILLGTGCIVVSARTKTAE